MNYYWHLVPTSGPYNSIPPFIPSSTASDYWCGPYKSMTHHAKAFFYMHLVFFLGLHSFGIDDHFQVIVDKVVHFRPGFNNIYVTL